MNVPNFQSDKTLVREPSGKTIADAADCLLAGKLIGMPTETVYGLAARGDDVDAVNRIFAAKNRPPNNPLILHVVSFEHACSLFATDASPKIVRRLARLGTLWPGPLTVIGPRRIGILDEVTAGGDTVAVRVPDHSVALALLAAVAEKAGHVVPIAAPSANVSNYVSPTTAKHVVDGLGHAVELVLDGGPCRVGLESTIVFLGTDSGPARILRNGHFSPECLSEVLEESVLGPAHPSISTNEAPQDEKIAAPGQFAKHYSPRTPLILLEDRSPTGNAKPADRDERVLRIVFTPIEPATGDNDNDVWTLAPDGRLETAASNLYAMLRHADEGGYDRIEVETCIDRGLGAAIMDRLRRATVR